MTDETQGDGRLLERLLFFSDAVFAIVLTLLVLELRPPHVEHGASLLTALRGMQGHFIAFFASFALVSIFWASHLSILRRLAAFDWLTAWVNLIFLFTIALMPFVSGLIGEYGLFGEPWLAYCAVLVAASLAQAALVATAWRDGGRLIGGVTRREVTIRLLRALSPGVVFAIGMTIVAAGWPRLGALCWVLFAPYYLLLRAFLRPREAKASAPPPQQDQPAAPPRRASRPSARRRPSSPAAPGA